LLPVYERGKPLETEEDRRQNFRGTVCGVFRPDVLIEMALSRLQPEGIDVALYDASIDRKQPFYYHVSRDRKDAPVVDPFDNGDDRNQSRYLSELQVAGHRWTIECISDPEFSEVRRTSWPSVTLVTGMIITAILAAYIMSSIDRRAYSEKLVHEKRIYARSLEHRVQERTGELRTAQEEIIQRLVSASLWRDEETGMHIRRTGLLSEALAKAAGWSAAEAELLRQAAPMHDVGKIGIPDAILRKPGQLTAEEYEVIKTHTLIGAEILADSNIPLMQIARQIALNHHEQWDGGGYPSGLVGHNIPEAARIVAIIDVFDALSHDRVYRKALSEDEVAAVMCQGSGSHFDPGLLATFFTILPELYQILSEHQDESHGGVSLIRSFAATLARTNFAENDELFQARNGIFTTTLVEEEV
jgi:HD-GYP domain-containing protein (c-di-GMP phosphodiesterase class II)